MDTRSNFHQSLEELQADLLKMGTLVEEAIYQAVKSLARMDVKMAEETIEQDDKIDQMMLEIEERCLRLIALQQPMAGDLRVIGMAMKIVTDLERIADHAVDIAKTTRRLAGETLVKPLVDIPRMADIAKEMLRDALTAFVEKNVARAEGLAEKDDQVDKLYTEIFQEIIGLMGTDLSVNRQVTHLLMVARYLERVADHATNIGEWVIYMVTGQRKDLNL
ncbi:phosphate signaling complex protein PhoU [Effusibacillus lacus]|uniref:Phosphate-specific transport system accessory protein PhoU n=1 Tax=Effusibacillus lacus TaxID=1348429 RepID=A0A292YC92_9BACL|nr:phosphate signaling complex protein PhoU [Effusibacillus lacus]TCS69800.1 phosphate transport system protein [Effusibacillus lacus]GAX88882.1 phosphate transport system regulatory protein PhoU [Effusibacillus lacus]